jgi:hypothetical protein
MKEIHTEIEIHASAEQVWNLLTDVERFIEWNPFIWRASGTIKCGERLTVEIRPPNSKAMTLRPTVLKAEPNRELRWLSQFFLPNLLDREHIFTIEPQAMFVLSSAKSTLAYSFLCSGAGSATKFGVGSKQ